MNKVIGATLFRYTSTGTIVGAAITGGFLSFWYGVQAGAVVLLGGIFGLVLLAAIVHSAHCITSTPDQRARSRFISTISHIIKWLVVAAVIYFISRSGVETAVFFAGGYTLSLIALVVGAGLERRGCHSVQGADDHVGDCTTDS